MTNKELQEKLKEYPDDAPVCYALFEFYGNKEVERILFDLDKVESDGAHVLLVQEQHND